MGKTAVQAHAQSARKPKKFSIGLIEAVHIAVSVVTIALAFTLFPEGHFTFDNFLLVLVTVGAGFVLHELGHKFVANKYGVHAEYRAWTAGLFFALALAFLTSGSFIFAAPGAVYIFGTSITREQNGKIAIAGAFVNFLLALLFLATGLALPRYAQIAFVGVQVNAFLGLFNLLPIFPLDGSKVFAWDKRAWGLLLAALAVLWIFNPLGAV